MTSRLDLPAHEAIASATSDLLGVRVLGVRALTGGISNHTYFVRLAPPAEPGEVVVRLFADRGRARTERAALRILEDNHAPAPRLLGHGCARGGGWLVLSTRVPGKPAARPDDHGWLDELAHTLATIHAVRGRGRSLTVDPGPARD